MSLKRHRRRQRKPRLRATKLVRALRRTPKIRRKPRLTLRRPR